MSRKPVSRSYDLCPKSLRVQGHIAVEQGFDLREHGFLNEDFLLAASGTLPAPYATADGVGTPTGGDYVNDAAGGVYALALATTNEAETTRLSFGDQLVLPVTEGTTLICRWKIEVDQTGAGGDLNTGDSLVLGLASAHNATEDSVAVNAWFRLQDAGLALLWETDDGTTDDNDNATSPAITIADNTYYTVRIHINDEEQAVFSVYNDNKWERVGAGDLSAASGTNLQPYIRLRKAAAANFDHKVSVDFIALAWKR